RLVAYVVASDSEPTVDALRAALAQSLPEHMVPALFVFLPALPKTAGGKPDRRALPAPDAIRPELAAGYVAPRTAAEATLAAVWAEVLRLDRVGVHDNFFSLGGDSILSLRAVALAGQRGLAVTLPDLFRAPTVADLARLTEGLAEAPAARREVAPFELISAADRARLPEDVV